MIDNIIFVMSHPATWAVLGILAKTFAPAWVPILGASQRLIKELVDVHGDNRIENKEIIQTAHSSGKKLAAKHLGKELL